MIPLAEKLQGMNCNVFIGSGEMHLSLFRKELPGVTYILFPGFKPGYSRWLPQYLFMLMKVPLLIFHIIREHFRLKKIIHENDIDIVISDNRFGLWNRKVKTVYITHMPLIPLPKGLRFFEFIGVYLHRAIIKRYSLCFIPDLPGDLNVTKHLLPDALKFSHNTVILSGPEPQRGMLKQKLAGLFKETDPPTIMLEGKPDEEIRITQSENIYYYSHLPSEEMKEIITGSDTIITRSGYTTIMELISLKCTAVLIPTPGQTEQEYLADYMSEQGWFSSIRQRQLKKGLSFTRSSSSVPVEIVEQSTGLLNIALEELLQEPHKQS